MQKNDKSYTFLLSHSSRSRIYIKRVEISKKFLRSGLFSAGLITGLLAITTTLYGIYGVVAADTQLAENSDTSVLNTTAGLTGQLKLIDYSRSSDAEFARNSGGPFDSVDADSDEAELERYLKTIETTSDPNSIPAIWAHSGKINNEFGFRRNPFGGRSYEFHGGLDIDGERGDIVISPANGKVVKAGWHGGYGNLIELDHGNGLTTRYGHLSKVEVTVGDEISRGQLMGQVGSTGRSTGPHLHYELRLNDRPINPRFFLPPEPTELKK